MKTASAVRRQTANDRFKSEFPSWMSWGVILAAALHIAVFQFFPNLVVRDLGAGENTIIDLVRVPEIDIPPPPEEIRGPEVPVVGDEMKIDEDVTISPTVWDERRLPPPPPDRVGDPSGRAGFVVVTLKPRLEDKARAQRIVERHYPRPLKQAGVAGSVSVEAYIDTAGRVLDARLLESSGHPQLDEAALEAVLEFEFTPALNRDQRVAVWIEQVIVFRVK